MCDFLETLSLNKISGQLLISSNYLTNDYWTSSLYFCDRDELSKENANTTQRRFKVNTTFHKTCFPFGCTIYDAKWMSQDEILLGTDAGDLLMLKLIEKDSILGLETIMEQREHDNAVTCVANVFDTQFAITGADDSIIKLWDLNERMSIQTFRAHESSIRAVKICPEDLKVFFSSSMDHRTVLWDVRKNKPAFLLKNTLNGFVSAIDWSSNNSNLIAFGSQTGDLGIYDLRYIREKASIVHTKMHSRLIRSIKFNDKNTMIATCSDDCTSQVSMLSNNQTSLVSKFRTSQQADYLTDLVWNYFRADEYITACWNGDLLFQRVTMK